MTETGWSVVLNDTPQQERLFAVALACLPANVRITKGPALHLERQEVSLTLDVALSEPLHDAATEQFQEKTGFRLTVTWPGRTQAAVAAPAVAASFPPTATPMEINTAYWTIEEAFRDQPETERPYRKSLKTLTEGTSTGLTLGLHKCGENMRQAAKYRGFTVAERKSCSIELAFLTPEVGARHQALLASLAAAIGYVLRIKPEPNQIALIALVRQLLPSAWQIAKPPGVFKAERAVRVKCLAASRSDTPERQTLRTKFTALTGYTLQIESAATGMKGE